MNAKEKWLDAHNLKPETKLSPNSEATVADYTKCCEAFQELALKLAEPLKDFLPVVSSMIAVHGWIAKSCDVPPHEYRRILVGCADEYEAKANEQYEIKVKTQCH